MKIKLSLIAMWGFVLGQEVTKLRYGQSLDTWYVLGLLGIVAVIVYNIREVTLSTVKKPDMTKH